MGVSQNKHIDPCPFSRLELPFHFMARCLNLLTPSYSTWQHKLLRSPSSSIVFHRVFNIFQHFVHGITDFPEMFHGFSRKCSGVPSLSYGCSYFFMVFPRVFPHFAIGFPCFSHGFPAFFPIFPWAKAMVFPR